MSTYSTMWHSRQFFEDFPNQWESNENKNPMKTQKNPLFTFLKYLSIFFLLILWLFHDLLWFIWKNSLINTHKQQRWPCIYDITEMTSQMTSWLPYWQLLDVEQLPNCCLQGQLCDLRLWFWPIGKMIGIRRINKNHQNPHESSQVLPILIE